MKRYNWLVLSVLFAVLAIAIAFSATLDPYRIVHPLLGEFSFEPNSRVPKLRYLMASCMHYNGYFVGDSRSATLSDRDLPKPSALRMYNFSTPADNVTSIVPRLKFLIGHGCPISTIIVDESLDVMLEQAELSRYGLLLSEHPRISGENWLSFYSRYFLSTQSLQTYFSARHKPSVTHDYYYPDGHADYLWGLEDASSFSLPRCGVPTLTTAQRSLMETKLAGYRALALLAVRYHFTAIVWIAPLNGSESPLVQDPSVANFIRQLHGIAELAVIEPDWQSPLLADFHQWHDCGHFRRTVFDQLIAPATSGLLPQVLP
jgi:hypothetical protein